MHMSKFSLNCRQIVLIAAAVSLLAVHAFGVGPVEKVIYSFGFADGFGAADLAVDASGNLYGTTSNGGQCCGAVFELTPPDTTGGAWTETILHYFQGGTDSGNPNAGVILDKQGNLYGTGVANTGTVYELSPPSAPGGAWTETTLWNFDPDPPYGYVPAGRLVMDGNGNLYGTTQNGGTHNDGIVFELVAPKSSRGPWSERVLHNFGAASGDGINPGPDLLLRDGYLYGTATSGGIGNLGIVFQLSRKPGVWSETIIHKFTGSDGAGPSGRLIADEDGNLYGITEGGTVGAKYSFGSVYELSPPSASGDLWQETTLYTFTGKVDGGNPLSGLWRDKSGSLYGTAPYGGAKHVHGGTAFKLNPPAVAGGDWTFVFLHTFGITADDGLQPSSGLTYSDGVFYGVTYSRLGTIGYGTVYSIVP